MPPWPTVVPRDRPETGATLGWLVNDKLSTKALEFVVCRFADDFLYSYTAFSSLVSSKFSKPTDGQNGFTLRKTVAIQQDFWAIGVRCFWFTFNVLNMAIAGGITSILLYQIHFSEQFLIFFIDWGGENFEIF